MAKKMSTKSIPVNCWSVDCDCCISGSFSHNYYLTYDELFFLYHIWHRACEDYNEGVCCLIIAIYVFFVLIPCFVVWFSGSWCLF